MSAITRYINGHKFYFDRGGVLIDPEAVNFEDSTFCPSLKAACAMHPAVVALDDLEYIVSNPSYEIGFDDIKYYWYTIENNGHLKVPKHILETIQYMKSGGTIGPRLQSRVDTRAQTANKNGYVYLLREINGLHYKIGRAKDPSDRKRVFTVKLPYQVEYECLIKTDNAPALEKRLHRKFAKKRANGEWFALEPADVEYIKSLTGGAE